MTDQTAPQRHFLLRRLHSLLGIVPIGVFLVEHMVTNSAVLLGGEEYQKDVDFIFALPALIWLEIFGIWLPIALHGVLGLAYTFTAHPNQGRYAYAANWRYALMRVSGVIALLYIVYHVSTTRWGWSWGVFDQSAFDAERATLTTALAVQEAWWTPWAYGLGVLAVVFHFANGLWTAAITWGLTVSPRAQRRWGFACAGLGALLTVMGLASVIAFARWDTGESGALVRTNPTGSMLSP